MQLATKRLLIRPWRSPDLAPFAEINADPSVRRYYHPPTLSRPESDEVVAECMRHLAEHAFSFLAVERRSDGALLGGCGLSHTDIPPGGPHIEIGWMIGREHWRNGYAREAGLAWLEHAWSIGLSEVVGYTSTINVPSRATMESVGLIRDPADDFEDRTVPADDPLRPHVLYRGRSPVA